MKPKLVDLEEPLIEDQNTAQALAESFMDPQK